MKSVLISIRPEWCEKIASGEKTVEVRKTRPKLEPPFKVYVYQTKHREHNGPTYSDGKVIGEFVCDDITKILNFITHFGVEGRSECELNTIARCSCLDYMDMLGYLGIDKDGYAWHISDLNIYESPRSIGEFCKPCDPDPQCDCRYCITHGRSPSKVVHAPQSWCYVEEVTP